MSIGKQILKARKELNLTQRSLAEKIGLPGSLVARWESDKAVPRAKNIEKLATALGKDYKYFYEEDFSDSGKLQEINKKIDIPTLGIIKNTEVTFVPSTSVPKKEDVELKKEFDMELLDDKLNPSYRKGEMLHILAIDTIKGNEGNHFIVRDRNGDYYIKKLERKNPKLEIIGVVLGAYRNTYIKK